MTPSQHAFIHLIDQSRVWCAAATSPRLPLEFGAIFRLARDGGPIPLLDDVF
jgi:hypothetical protein